MICGIDEAGRGPVIGPMVVTAIWIEADKEIDLIDSNVRDSKKLSVQRRENLAGYLEQNFKHESTIVEAKDIDSLRQTMTINQLEAYIFANLANKHEASIYYIDAASTNEQTFKELIQKRVKYDSTIVCEHGADDLYAVVSAASIIAKVKRDQCITRITSELREKLDIPLGSGYPSDERTIAFIKEWIKKFNVVPPYTRKSWKTVKNIEKELKQNKLF